MLQTVLPYPDVLIQDVGIPAVSARETGSAQKGRGHYRVRFGSVELIRHQLVWCGVSDDRWWRFQVDGGDRWWLFWVAGGVRGIDCDGGGGGGVEVVV